MTTFDQLDDDHPIKLAWVKFRADQEKTNAAESLLSYVFTEGFIAGCDAMTDFARADQKEEVDTGVWTLSLLPKNCRMTDPDFAADRKRPICTDPEVYTRELNDHPDYEVWCKGCDFKYKVDGPDA